MIGISELVVSLLALHGAGPTLDADRLRRPVAALPMAWRVERLDGPGPGDRTCLVRSLGRFVTVRFFRPHTAARARVTVRVGYRNQPGSLQYLRINRKIFQTSEDSFEGRVAEDIVARLKGPGEFAFEWAMRPDYAKRQGLFAIGAFAARAEECARWLEGRRA